MESVIYDGSHSIIFDGKHSWLDWRLIPASRPIVPLPQMNVKDVEIPGRSGKIDLSTYQAGHITYKNTNPTFGFYVANDVRPWTETYSRIAEHLLGRKVKVVLTDDSKYYYYGYCVPSFGNGDGRLVVQISCDFNPFKRPVYLNPNLNRISVSGTKNISVQGSIAYDCPTVTTSSAITVTYNGTNWSVPAGTHTLYDLQFGPGTHTVALKGTATVTFDFRGGVI